MIFKKHSSTSSLSFLIFAFFFSQSWLSVASAQLVINTPVLTTCQNTSLTWTGAAAGNVYLSVVPGGQPTSEAIETFPPVDQASGTYTWLVDQPENTSLTFLITDSTGKSTGSAAVTVTKGFSTSCIGKGESSTKEASNSDSSSDSSSSSNIVNSGTTDSSAKSKSSGSTSTVVSPASGFTDTVVSPSSDSNSTVIPSTTNNKVNSPASSAPTISPVPSIPAKGSTSAAQDGAKGTAALYQGQAILCSMVVVVTTTLLMTF